MSIASKSSSGNLSLLHNQQQIQLGFLEQWRQRKATDVEMGVVVSLWIVSIIVRYLRNISFERMSFELTDCRFIHHIDMRSGLFYMDSNYLANNHNWGTCFFYKTWDAAVIQYSTNCWRRHRYSILNDQFLILNTSETWLILKKNWRRRKHYPLLNELSETMTRSTFDTQRFDGDAIDIGYSATAFQAEALVGSTWYSRNWRNLINARVLPHPFKHLYKCARRHWYSVLLDRGQTPWLWSNQSMIITLDIN